MLIPFDYDQYQWKSRTKYPDGVLMPWEPNKTVLHWLGHAYPGHPSWTLEEMVAHEMSLLRSAQRGHIDGKLWFDLGYSYAVGNSGMRYRIRGENRAAATRGDYEDDGIPENHQARALVWLGGLGYLPSKAAFIAMGTMIDPTKPVTLHWEHKATQCPGKDWAAWRDRKGWETGGLISESPIEGYKMRTVRYGMGSAEKPDGAVAMLQRGMSLKGHHDKKTIDRKCGADGIARFGTVQQIKDFQQAHGLVIDGIGGDATWAEADKE